MQVARLSEGAGGQSGGVYGDAGGYDTGASSGGGYETDGNAVIVRPGDQLHLEVEQKRMVMRMGQFVCTAKVDGEVVASAEMLCAERAA